MASVARRTIGAVSVALCALAAAFAVGSCGYRLQAPSGSRFADPGVRIDLRPFSNPSFIPDAGAFLAGRLREEMRVSGFRGTFDSAAVDYIVEGKIRSVTEDISSLTADRFSLENRMTLSVDIRVVEVVRGRLLWKEEGLTEAASYFAGPDFQYTESNRRAAFEELCRRMSRRIGQTLRVIL